MIRNIDNRYTTIDRLILSDGEQNLIDACDPTGASDINASNVQQKLLDFIYQASREVDAYLIKFMTCPIAETITTLTVGTSVMMTNGSTAVVGIGTTFLTELEEGDEIFLPDDESYWFGVIDSVTDNLNLVLKYEYNGDTTDADTASRRRIVVPPWVELHVRNYALYSVWRRRGRDNVDNPWYEDKEASRASLKDFQRSKQKFDDGGTKRKHNPIRAGKTTDDRVMTQTSLAKYTDPDLDFPSV